MGKIEPSTISNVLPGKRPLFNENLFSCPWNPSIITESLLQGALQGRGGRRVHLVTQHDVKVEKQSSLVWF